MTASLTWTGVLCFGDEKIQDCLFLRKGQSQGHYHERIYSDGPFCTVLYDITSRPVFLKKS